LIEVNPVTLFKVYGQFLKIAVSIVVHLSYIDPLLI
jgi:hypothetical protein